MASAAAASDKHAPASAPYAFHDEEARDEPSAAFELIQPLLPRKDGVPDGAPDLVATNEWEIGICDCCSTPEHCCMAFFFPCVNGAYVAHYIGMSSILVGGYFLALYTGDWVFSVIASSDKGAHLLSSLRGHSSFSVWEALSMICSALSLFGVFVLRLCVREFYRIKGSCIEDCCCSFLCSCCTMSQMSAHTQIAKNKRLENAAMLPAYRAV